MDNFLGRNVVFRTTKRHNGVMRYNPWELPEDDDSDDRYDAMKDAYAEGWGAPYNERTRREAREEWENERGW